MCCVAINEASLIVVEANQLLDVTIVGSLAIPQSSARVNSMPIIPEPNIRVVAKKAVAINAIVVAVIGVVDRPMVGLCHGCPCIVGY